MTRKEFLSQMPWYVRGVWWFITILMLVFYVTPIILLLIINPLWFRNQALAWATRHIERLGYWRDNKFKKYALFDLLKNV